MNKKTHTARIPYEERELVVAFEVKGIPFESVEV